MDENNITPEYIIMTASNMNNTAHPEIRTTAYTGDILKVIRADKNPKQGKTDPQYNDVYVCEGGYVVYQSGCIPYNHPIYNIFN